ncbi:uncharacterized protein ACBT44_003853 isoform 3-T3 [Syngnathus typhle]
MGNLQLTTGLFTTGAPPPQPDSRFTSRPISRGITYYQACQPSSTSSATHDPLHATLSSRASPSPRPLLLFFSWLGAHPGAAAKYFDAFLARGMDVLLVQSGVMHFLWPRWGQNYALEVLKVLDRPEFSGRPFLVYASSIGGYTFTQVLVHVAHGHAKHATLPHRVVGHIYDSLVAGTLEHMATGDNIQQVESVLNEEMKKNKMWFDWNKLSLNGLQVVVSAAATPNSNTAGEDALNGATVKCCHYWIIIHFVHFIVLLSCPICITVLFGGILHYSHLSFCRKEQ